MPKLKWDKIDVSKEELKKFTFKWYVIDTIKRSALSLWRFVQKKTKKIVSHQVTLYNKLKSFIIHVYLKSSNYIIGKINMIKDKIKK